MIETLVRFVLGGALVALIPMLAEKLGPQAAGAALLFPAVSFAGLLFVGVEQGIAQTGMAALSALWSLPTVAIFLIAVYFASRAELPLILGLCAGLFLWLVVAVVVVLLRPGE